MTRRKLAATKSWHRLIWFWAHTTRPEFTYRHRWRVGDLLIWDNRATLHRRDPFDLAARRLMHRTQIRGQGAPVAA